MNPIAWQTTNLGQMKETTMTTLTEYSAARLNSSLTTSLLSADLVIAGLCSLLGLIFSAVLVMSGFAADIGEVLAIAG